MAGEDADRSQFMSMELTLFYFVVQEPSTLADALYIMDKLPIRSLLVGRANQSGEMKCELGKAVAV